MSTYTEELERAYKQSRGGGNRPIVCPGPTCKLCGLIRPILNFKDRHDQVVVDMANQLRAKYQHFSNVCLDPDYNKVVLFCYGKQIMDCLVRLQCDPIISQDFANFAHPTKGRIILIEKIIGTNGRPQYSASPRAQIHAVPRLGMKPHNLAVLRDLLKQGVEYYPQKLLDVKTTPVRFLGFGKDGTRFFRTVEMHWGISQEDFGSIQTGSYNPFLITASVDMDEPLGEEPIGEDLDVPMFEDEAAEAELAYSVPSEIPQDMAISSDLEEESTPETTTVDVEKVKEMTKTEPKEDKPPCWGKEYDPDDTECTEDCKTWSTSCRDAFLKRYGAE